MSTPHTLSYMGTPPAQAHRLVRFGVSTPLNSLESPSKELVAFQAPPAFKPETKALTNKKSEWIYQGAEWISRNIYSRAPGIRYAFEEVGGFTAPRILQQWTRSHSITGLFNTAAAMEVAIRELASDFTNTLLPGLINYRVSRSIDQKHQTLLSKNLGSDSINF